MENMGFVNSVSVRSNQRILRLVNTCPGTHTLRVGSAPAVLPAPAHGHATGRDYPEHSFGKGCGTAIVLFRSDLRVDDHPALTHALEEAANVIPVFCFDPRHFGRTAHGFEKTGMYRTKFLVESVAALRNTLRARGSDLIVRLGRPEEVVPDLCKRTGARAVFAHKETTYEEVEVERALAKALKRVNASFTKFWAGTLYHEEDLPFAIDEVPDVYTAFREAVERHSIVREPLPAPNSLPAPPKSIARGDVPTLRELGVAEVGREEKKGRFAGIGSIVGGEDEARRRVAEYLGTERPGSALGSDGGYVVSHLNSDFSCRISPWLAMGCISPRRIYADMKAVCGGQRMQRTCTYLELVWRDFFRCVTAKYCTKRSTPVQEREMRLAGV